MRDVLQAMYNLERAKARHKLKEDVRPSDNRTFIERHLGIFIPAFIGLLTAAVSTVQIYIANIDNERQWKIEAAKFVANNWNKVYSDDPLERATMLLLASEVFPENISEMIRQQSDKHRSASEKIRDVIFKDSMHTELDPEGIRLLKKCWIEVGVPETTLLTDFVLADRFTEKRQIVDICLAGK